MALSTVSSAGPASAPAGDVRSTVIRAARRLLAERGLEVSMDDLALAAGVGRRTLFRHFDSRDALIASALDSSLDWYHTRLPEQVDDLGDASLDEWLSALALRVHRTHHEAGRALWQLAAMPDADLPEPLAAVNRRRRRARRVSTRSMASAGWSRVGGVGECPEEIVDAFALMLSSFATRSVVDDFGRTPTAAATATATALAALLRASVSG